MYLSTSTSTEDFPEMYLSTFQVLYKLYLSTDVLKYKVLLPGSGLICMDNIMKRANQEENSIEELMFADDLVLIAEDQIRLQEMVSNLDQQCKNYGMRISRDKTEVMVTSREPIQCDIELDGETLKQVEQFKYLGSIFVREGGCKEDVKTRCLKAAQVFYQLSPILGHKEISMITKTQIIKAVFTPQLYFTRVKTGPSPAKKGRC